MRLAETVEIAKAFGKVRVSVMCHQDSLYHVEGINRVNECFGNFLILRESEVEDVCNGLDLVRKLHGYYSILLTDLDG